MIALTVSQAPRSQHHSRGGPTNLITINACSGLPTRSSTKAQQTWRTIRPAARSSQQHTTASTLEIPEGLNLIDSLFEGIPEHPVHIHDATHALEQQGSLAATQHSRSGEAPANTSSSVGPSAHVNSVITPNVASSTQRSKLLQRLQTKRIAVPSYTVPQAASAEVDTVDGIVHTQSSRSSRARPFQQPSTSALPSRPQQQLLADSDRTTVNGNSSSKYISSREGTSTAAAASAAAATAPRNPWLIRQQQQRKIQQQQQAARLLASQQQQEQQQRDLEQERLLQRQQLQQQLRNQQQKQHAARAAATPAAAEVGAVQQPCTRRIQSHAQGARRQPARSQPHPQQQQQQQQRSAENHIRDQHPRQHQQQRVKTPQEKVFQPAAAEAAAPPDQAVAHHQQQQQQQQQQQPSMLLQSQTQQAAVILDGVIRSSRRSRPSAAAAVRAAGVTPAATSYPSHQQQQTPIWQGPDLPPAVAAIAASAAAAAGAGDNQSSTAPVDNIGQMPLLVTGGYAAGSDVVWMNKAQLQMQQPATAAAAAAQGRGNAAATLQQHGRSSSTSKAGIKTGGSRSSGRYRRTAKLLQGIVTSPHPNLRPLAAAEAPVAAAAAPTVATPATAAVDTQNGSSTSTDAAQDVQQQQQQQLHINNSNWQHMALQRLQGLFTPVDHTSMYTFAVDVWAAALQPPAAAQPRSGSSSGIKPARSGSSAPAAWCISCLYSPDRYIWCSVLLALLDSLADDSDLARVGLAATVLPRAVSQQLVLPAAELLDDEVYRDLLQAVDKLESGSSSSRMGAGSAAAAAVQPVIGPAPWLNQQLRQKGSAESSSCSSGVDDNSSAIGATSQQIQISDQAAVAAAGAAEDEVVAGAAELLEAFQELQQLQGLYPGVELSALAHVAQLHGVWT